MFYKKYVKKSKNQNKNTENKETERKYKNRKVEFNGIKFDSKKELKRYKELLLLEKANKIKDLQLKTTFELIPNQKINGRVVERKIKYIADFVYFDNELNTIVVEDTKGIRTDVYKIKRKLMLYTHKIQIKEI